MTDARKVWMPDTFFRNEKEGRFHNILVPNVYIRIFPDGYVLYSIRLVSTICILMGNPREIMMGEDNRVASVTLLTFTVGPGPHAHN